MTIKTRTVDVKIKNGEELIFQKLNFRVPEDWSDRAATIVASKYAMDNENSALAIIDRVVNQITNWGVQQKYFDVPSNSYNSYNGGGETCNDPVASDEFKKDLKDILINQRAAFNSPVWFNCGSDTGTDQMSACFIVPVEDTMESILEHNTIEGTIFRGGSGAGCNVSNLRGKGEKLSNKGVASGPISFMKMWDSTAGAIRSGGKTRRSAKMICMDSDHPDIMDFIHCKKIEEDKAKALIAAGIDPEEAYATVSFQNTNHSIRVSNSFMEAVVLGEGSYDLVNRGDGKTNRKLPAAEILSETARIAWLTGDPGIQFDDRMNIDNPIASIGRINSTNPCSEFSAVDNSSCNLASLNLIKYYNETEFDYDSFREDIKVLITAMDILIDAADYPTEEIRETTVTTRPLGLGFSNLGALLMLAGIPYDSNAGRKWAAEITKEMTTAAYMQSINLAAKLGSFKHYEDNKDDNMDIALRLTENSEVEEAMTIHGLRNSQVTLLAPTGTISFMMDCDTTGIEPLFALKTIKKLAGGGILDIDYPCVRESIDKFINFIPGMHGGKGMSTEEIINHKYFEEKKDVYKTANDISWKGHIDMMAACQKHLNGAISKTVNMSEDINPSEIEEAYIYAWQMGLKCLAIYRDGCKDMQPMTDVNNIKEETVQPTEEETGWSPFRLKLPETRHSLTHKFNVGGLEGYLTVGTYEDGNPGEIFIRTQKQGSTMQGVLDSFATAVSLALQYGVPLETLIRKFVGSKFEPAGFTPNEDIRMTTSIMDYMFRWLELTFIDEEDDSEYVEEATSVNSVVPKLVSTFDGPDCKNCGSVTSRNGTCYVCSQCGETTGCS